MSKLQKTDSTLQPLQDYSNYIGISYDDINCYDLVKVVYCNEFDIVMPDFNGKEIVNDRLERWERVKSPLPNDILLFSRGVDRHVGLCVSDKTMLHTVDHKDSCIERFDRNQWANNLIAIYRYKG